MYTKPIRLSVDKTLGYQYFMDKEHPLASKIGRVYYHRHVASLKIGRWLSKDEVVHHRDSNRVNNDWGNLEILGVTGHHFKHHPEVLIKPCKSCGKSFQGDQNRQLFCSVQCAHIPLKKFSISREALQDLV